MPNNEQQEPWLKLFEESPAAFHAFEHYLDLGVDRTMRGAWHSHRRICQSKSAPHPVMTPGNWNVWAKTYRWQERAYAWDIYQARKRAKHRQKQIDLMNRRHLVLSMKMQEHGFNALLTMSPAELAARDLPKWLDQAVKMEREARGLPGSTELTEHRMSDTPSFNRATDAGQGIDLDTPLLTEDERMAAMDVGTERRLQDEDDDDGDDT